MVEKCYLEAGNSSTGEILVLQSMSTWVSSAHQPKKKKKPTVVASAWNPNNGEDPWSSLKRLSQKQSRFMKNEWLLG